MNSEILIFNFGHFTTLLSIICAIFWINLNPIQKIRVKIFFDSHSFKSKIYVFFSLCIFFVFILNEYFIRLNNPIFNGVGPIISLYFGLFFICLIIDVIKIIFVNKIKIDKKNHSSFSRNFCNFLSSNKNLEYYIMVFRELEPSLEDILCGTIHEKDFYFRKSCQNLIYEICKEKNNLLNISVASGEYTIFEKIFEFIGLNSEKIFNLDCLYTEKDDLIVKKNEFWFYNSENLSYLIVSLLCCEDEVVKNMRKNSLVRISRNNFVCLGMYLCIDRSNVVDLIMHYPSFEIKSETKKRIFLIFKSWLGYLFDFFVEKNDFLKAFNFSRHILLSSFYEEEYCSYNDIAFKMSYMASNHQSEECFFNFIKNNFESILNSSIFNLMEKEIFDLCYKFNPFSYHIYYRNEMYKIAILFFCLGRSFNYWLKINYKDFFDENEHKKDFYMGFSFNDKYFGLESFIFECISKIGFSHNIIRDKICRNNVVSVFLNVFARGKYSNSYYKHDVLEGFEEILVFSHLNFIIKEDILSFKYIS